MRARLMLVVGASLMAVAGSGFTSTQGGNLSLCGHVSPETALSHMRLAF